MSKMVPPFLSSDVKSRAEKRVFEMLRDDPETSEWTCLHSLGLARHINQTYGEIDFVVLVPGHGIFCLEVKGGRIGRQEGVWTYTNRYGESDSRTKSPFRQAQDGMFSLRDAIKESGAAQRLGCLLFGYGVVFPDISYQNSDPEHEGWQIFDRDYRAPISHFILNLAKHTHAKMQFEGWYSSGTARPSKKQISGFLDLVRGDFDLIVRPSQALAQSAEELLKLTEEQFQVLDALQDNPRLLMEGAAGTGKTVLAVEWAKREALNGRRVLLCCFNRMLGKWIRSQISAWSLTTGMVYADSFHHFLEEIISQSTLRQRFIELRTGMLESDQGSFFQQDYPIYVLDALAEGAVAPFDVLVIDEGQDLIRTEYLDVFDALLTGGLAGGRWIICADFQRQAIFAEGVSEADMRGALDRRTSSCSKYRLNMNCRNTCPIAEETALLSGFATPPCLPSHINGPSVDYHFFTDTTDERGHVISLISQLLKDGVNAGQITVLSAVSLSKSCLAEPVSGRNFSVKDAGLEVTERGGNTVTFSTIHAFKGLENSVVILVDLQHIEGELYAALLYVGMSRARHMLYVLLAEEAREEYDSMVRRNLAKDLVSK